MIRAIVLVCSLLLLAGCSSAPALRPVLALEQALAHPEVARWYEAHSAPRVLEGLDAGAARRWRKYKPAATVDLVRDGLQIRLESRLGPEPRRMEALLNRETGAVLSIRSH